MDHGIFGFASKSVTPILFALAVFGAVYYAKNANCRGEVAEALQTARAVDAENLSKSLVAETALRRKTDVIDQSNLAITAALRATQPVSTEYLESIGNCAHLSSDNSFEYRGDLHENEPEFYSVDHSDPLLSLAAVRLLNAASSGTFADAAAFGNASSRENTEVE